MSKVINTRLILVNFTKAVINSLTSSPKTRHKLYSFFVGIDKKFSITPIHRLWEYLKDVHFTIFNKSAYTSHRFLSAFDLKDIKSIGDNKRKQRRIIILAAGRGIRWRGNGLKQLIIIKNKPLIEH